MAGIKVPQYAIYKIGTNKLKSHKWNLKITEDEAWKLEEMIKLFEGQEFRMIAKILNKNISNIDFSEYICSVVIENKSHFERATSTKGIKINGNTFRRFVGTTGGLKNNTLLFVNVKVIDKLNEMCECKRNQDIPLVPAKYEAYKALTCSASQPIVNPRRILVVDDCITHFTSDVIKLDNSEANEKRELKAQINKIIKNLKKSGLDEVSDKDINESAGFNIMQQYKSLKDSPKSEYIPNCEMENTISDGFSICTYEYMKAVSESLELDYVTNGVCLRNAWFKGMMYAFPIIEFIDKYNNGNYMIKDIWGNYQDIRECDIVTTVSSLKLWGAYGSIDEYMKAYEECGYGFSVTKISPHKLDDQRELNYQYLQSYEFTDEDIEKLTAPTIKNLKDSMCGDYETTIKFLGISEETEDGTWQKALYNNEYMLGDPFIIDSVHRMIKKKIDNAKIGKLLVDGNYQIASGDPFALMQSLCGLEITGLLKANECYSSYWNNKNVDEVVIFRSPMSIHSNIRKCQVVNNEDVRYWYQYMDNIMIINGWDTFMQAENGCDFDSDILFSTNNEILVNRHRTLPAVDCQQSNTLKVPITEEAVKITNKNGMGNKVGVITNRVTAMMEVQARFEPGSREYKELEYRISCGQLYQQDELDKIKGIVATPMPVYWYNEKACIGMEDEEFLKSICVDKKPYFMIYVYEDYKKKYKKYIDTSNSKSYQLFGCSVEELQNKTEHTEEEKEFLKWFEIKQPFGMSKCAMNKICYHVEKELNGYKIELKHSSTFDYNFLKVKRRCSTKNREALEKLCEEYVDVIKKYKANKAKNGTSCIVDKDLILDNRKNHKEYYHNKAKELCPDDNERLNIVLDMCYQYKANKQFCWDVIGDLICKRLEELNNENIRD